MIFAPMTHERMAPTQSRSVATNDLLRQLAEARSREPVPSDVVVPEVDPAEREAALQSVMQAVVADPESAFRSVAVLYQDFVVRCRIHAVPGEPMDLGEFRRQLAVVRAGVSVEAAEGSDWEAAVASVRASHGRPSGHVSGAGARRDGRRAMSGRSASRAHMRKPFAGPRAAAASVHGRKRFPAAQHRPPRQSRRRVSGSRLADAAGTAGRAGTGDGLIFKAGCCVPNSRKYRISSAHAWERRDPKAKRNPAVWPGIYICARYEKSRRFYQVPIGPGDLALPCPAVASGDPGRARGRSTRSAASARSFVAHAAEAETQARSGSPIAANNSASSPMPALGSAASERRQQRHRSSPDRQTGRA